MTTSEEPLDLAAIQARADRATPAPWTHYYPGQDCVGHCVDPVAHDMAGLVETHANAEFISAAREDIPALLARVRTLVAERDEASQDADDIADLWRKMQHRALDAEAKLALAEQAIHKGMHWDDYDAILAQPDDEAASE